MSSSDTECDILSSLDSDEYEQVDAFLIPSDASCEEEDTSNVDEMNWEPSVISEDLSPTSSVTAPSSCSCRPSKRSLLSWMLLASCFVLQHRKHELRDRVLLPLRKPTNVVIQCRSPRVRVQIKNITRIPNSFSSVRTYPVTLESTFRGATVVRVDMSVQSLLHHGLLLVYSEVLLQIRQLVLLVRRSSLRALKTIENVLRLFWAGVRRHMPGKLKKKQ